MKECRVERERVGLGGALIDNESTRRALEVLDDIRATLSEMRLHVRDVRLWREMAVVDEAFLWCQYSA